MSGQTVMRMLYRNVPLCRWESFVDSGMFYGQSKNPDKTARLIFGQLSHEAVVRLLAREFNELPPQVRLALRDLCNTGNASGNVRKNVQRLNDMLDGKLLADKRALTFNERVETLDGVRFRRRVVNPAVAGATRKYGVKP